MTRSLCQAAAGLQELQIRPGTAHSFRWCCNTISIGKVRYCKMGGYMAQASRGESICEVRRGRLRQWSRWCSHWSPRTPNSQPEGGMADFFRSDLPDRSFHLLLQVRMARQTLEQTGDDGEQSGDRRPSVLA